MHQAHELHQKYIFMNATLVEFVYLVFTRMPGESYRSRFVFAAVFV